MDTQLPLDLNKTDRIQYNSGLFPQHSDLPLEVALRIFMFFTFLEAIRVNIVCKRWKFILFQDKQFLKDFMRYRLPYIEIPKDITPFGVSWNPIKEIHQTFKNILNGQYSTRDDF